MDITIKQAIDKFIEELRKDPEYFNGWQANIAISFQDELSRYRHHNINNHDVHEITNNAAKNFLKLLTHVNTEE